MPPVEKSVKQLPFIKDNPNPPAGFRNVAVMPDPAIILDFSMVRISYYLFNPLIPDFRMIAPCLIFVISNGFHWRIIHYTPTPFPIKPPPSRLSTAKPSDGIPVAAPRTPPPRRPPTLTGNI